MRVRKNVEMSERLLDGYHDFLLGEERSATIVKRYFRDMKTFLGYMGEAALDRKRVLDYKQGLRERYKITGTNPVLAAMSSFFVYLGGGDLKVKLFKMRRALYARPEWGMTEKDHRKLIQAARSGGNETMNTLIQTIGSTGIWISELKFIMVESLASGRVEIHSKGESRTVLLSVELSKVLREYCRKAGTVVGNIFITKHENPANGSNVNKKVKALGRAARVDTAKVSPHNLRHLLTKIFYSTGENTVKLTDLLEHSSVSTTRIYATSTEEQPRRQMSRMKLAPGQPRRAEQ